MIFSLLLPIDLFFGFPRMTDDNNDKTNKDGKASLAGFTKRSKMKKRILKPKIVKIDQKWSFFAILLLFDRNAAIPHQGPCPDPPVPAPPRRPDPPAGPARGAIRGPRSRSGPRQGRPDPLRDPKNGKKPLVPL